MIIILLHEIWLVKNDNTKPFELFFFYIKRRILDINNNENKIKKGCFFSLKLN